MFRRIIPVASLLIQLAYAAIASSTPARAIDEIEMGSVGGPTALLWPLYIGTATGRDLNLPMTQGLQALPDVKPARFSLNYHLLALRQGAPRLRLQCWLDDGDPVDSVVSVWPAADWLEREQYDLMGIRFEGHPNLARLLMEDDWEGHPLRKDYPIGGEPVRFSPAE